MPFSSTSRRRIVRAAISEFAKKGYTRASLASIARAAGVSKSGLLHYFPSKELLLREAMAQMDATHGISQSPDAEEPDHTGGPDDDAIAESISARLATALDDDRMWAQFSVLMLAEALTDGSVSRDVVAAKYLEARSDLARRMKRKYPEVPDEIINRAAVAMSAIVDGLNIAALMDPDTPIADTFDTFYPVLRDYLNSF
ncbi:helix-turn-helix domain-containing protein [Gordonia sp. L191]|uniref:TetR/AcrR family transcriptional regulator n=1 Tax=Gordonia sp. L191 TaxID=2982699 RepID=UPI0024C0731D|nr:TetR/AcrR family transcriptional regulator [Gordonia sp. L191]WHU47184.1 helix-turn-helix domain-containing protein [Gordonia sp. L191]